jgi:hypothetical protein
MQAWRLLLLVPFLLLGGCLVSFREPLPANEPAPIPLLGEWTHKNEWGERIYMRVSRAGSNLYKALVYQADPDDPEDAQEYGFTVAQHGRRWYFSAGLPKRLGNNFAIAGFELTTDNELVIYTLDVQRILQAIDDGTLTGKRVDTPEGDGALISSDLQQVFAYLDDQANTDTFIEVARFQRVGQ